MNSIDNERSLGFISLVESLGGDVLSLRGCEDGGDNGDNGGDNGGEGGGCDIDCLMIDPGDCLGDDCIARAEADF
jgi:hypothetical protein